MRATNNNGPAGMARQAVKPGPAVLRTRLAIERLSMDCTKHDPTLPDPESYETDPGTSDESTDPQKDAPRQTGAPWSLTWDGLSLEERLDLMVTMFEPKDWFLGRALVTLACIRDKPRKWNHIKAQARARGVYVKDLEEAVDDVLKVIEQARQAEQEASALTDAPGQEKTPPTPADRPRFQTISAKELYAKQLPDLAYILPEILPIGETLFTGRGKDGKSLLVWNLCLAVATAGKALGRKRASARASLGVSNPRG